VPLTLGNISRHIFLLGIVLCFRNWITYFQLPHTKKVNQFAFLKKKKQHGDVRSGISSIKHLMAHDLTSLLHNNKLYNVTKIILGCVRKDRENSVIKRNFYIIELKLPNGDRRRFDCSNA